ncbi:WD repeat-containing protein 44-like [Pistacia vera]|uniref:WD repeat-containing protein 44-like n=1 Tax=Pistacia vera TaxID=55513 RepID=UPI001262D1A2|nr:WD repeat-containing protein 44-like [Pistacia vera]
MERKKTLTMNWDGLGDDDDDDRFFETFDRTSNAVPLDLASSCSDDDDEGFEDSRMSFVSTVSSVHHHQNFATSAAAAPCRDGLMSCDYNVWTMAPGSINERRKRLFEDMGLSRDKELLTSSTPQQTTNNVPVNVKVNDNVTVNVTEEANKQENPSARCSPVPLVLVRSRSDGDIESLCVDKRRKEEMIGKISKQRLTRTSSMVLAPNARINPYQESVRVANNREGGTARSRSVRRGGSALTSIVSNGRLGAFFLIKNLDTGKEFIVNEYNEKGMWNRLSDLQTGKQLTMEEFEKSVGYSPVVKELMRRENVSGNNENTSDNDRKFGSNSYFSKSLRISKRRGAALLKNIKGVANSMSLRSEKEKEHAPPHAVSSSSEQQKQQSKGTSNQWVKVRQTGKSHKELSALHLCQEIQAHEGSIWSIKFSLDARFLASAGEDRVIHVWEVQECEVMSMNEGNLTPIHISMGGSPDRWDGSEKKKKGSKGSPDYVHVPETVFSLSDKPVYSFKGHLDDVLDLSWSRSQLLLSSSMDKTVRLWDLETKSCLKLFAHNDYVTCIQFNPVDDDYFISGSLDAKVRIWSISQRLVVDWTDLHEMVTAACYTPDGQSAFIGSHKGTCRMYSIDDSKLHQLNQTEFQTKKKSNAKKITGFQFSPSNPSEVLVTSADSRIRILDGLDLVHKFRGFRNTSSQISASFSLDGKYLVCASEDSQVYVWKREDHRNIVAGKRSKVSTTSHEHFQCKDVSVAITWPGIVKGEPPLMPSTSKRLAKRLGQGPSSANGSPTREEMKKLLPPLPKKNNNKMDHASTPPEEDLALVSRDTGIGESFNSSSSSIRSGDSISISAADSSFPSWSSSWSWFDGGNHSNITTQTTAWGLVIVTATLGGEIRTYQNFGLPRRLGRLRDPLH